MNTRRKNLKKTPRRRGKRATRHRNRVTRRRYRGGGNIPDADLTAIIEAYNNSGFSKGDYAKKPILDNIDKLYETLEIDKKTDKDKDIIWNSQKYDKITTDLNDNKCIPIILTKEGIKNGIVFNSALNKGQDIVNILTRTTNFKRTLNVSLLKTTTLSSKNQLVIILLFPNDNIVVGINVPPETTLSGIKEYLNKKPNPESDLFVDKLFNKTKLDYKNLVDNHVTNFDKNPYGIVGYSIGDEEVFKIYSNTNLKDFDNAKERFDNDNRDDRTIVDVNNLPDKTLVEEFVNPDDEENVKIKEQPDEPVTDSNPVEPVKPVEPVTKPPKEVEKDLNVEDVEDVKEIENLPNKKGV